MKLQKITWESLEGRYQDFVLNQKQVAWKMPKTFVLNNKNGQVDTKAPEIDMEEAA